MRHSPLLFCSLAALFAGLMFPACGSSSKGGSAAPQGDAGDAGSTSTEGGGAEAASPEASGDDGGSAESGGFPGYPAFPPAMGQLYDIKEGPVLSTPRIVTITWARDPDGPTYQAFDDAIGTSDFWTNLAQYGVGPATSVAADHVVIQTDLPSWDTSEIDSWTNGMIAGSPGNGWPAPDAQTVYIVYTPSDTTVTQGGGNACNTEGGYHTSLPGNHSNKDGVAYALAIGNCYQGTPFTAVQSTTQTGSHELAEAATDPYPGPGPAWDGYDAPYLGWSLWDNWEVLNVPPEVSDMCEFFADEYSVQGTGNLNYSLSTIWSNSSASAGHYPCVPIPSGAKPYNNVTPLGLTSVTVQAPDYTNTLTTFTTQGWHISPGQTANVTVGLNSDVPTGAWGVQAYEGDCCQNTTSYLTVTPASFSGKNGDQVQLSITVNSAPTNSTSAILLTFWSASGKNNHYMPVIIGAY